MTNEVAEYSMTVHLFGVLSSPSHACYALMRTVDDHQGSFPDEVIDNVHINFYVDDCLKSSPSVEKAVQIVNDLCDLCQKGGFHLTQWISNSREFLQAIPEKDHSKNVSELNLDREKALGLQWCMERHQRKDTFNFHMDCKEQIEVNRGFYELSAQCMIP